MEPTKSFRDLIVWQKSMRLVGVVYLKTKNFPREELYGLTSQMRRAAIAIPANLAEGYARRFEKEYAQFTNVAYGSGAELETQIEIAKNLGYLTDRDHQELIDLLTEVMRMLNKLSNTLRKRKPV